MIRQLSAILNHSALQPLLCVACFLLAVPEPAHAFKPEDPEVRSMVDRGIRYLEGLTESEVKSTPYGGGDGQAVLIGYAHLKAEHNEESPVVKLALANALQLAAGVASNGGKLDHQSKSHYEIPIAIMFLAELDANGYKQQLETLGKGMLDLQMPHGGYGYPTQPHGDVSQVQYVVLAMWTLDRAGIDLPLDRVARTLAWLMRVQDPTGYWPYHGHDPGVGKGLETQPTQEMSVSTCLAGGSSVLIASDVFRLLGKISLEGNGIEGLPKALNLVEKEGVISLRRKKAPVTRDAVLAATSRMDSYRTKNPFQRTGQADWFYYMLYTLERYESFMELSVGKVSQVGWYDEGVKVLMQAQDKSGAWAVKDASKNGPPVSTAFAILFLIRSTKKSIGAASTGSLAGGYKLPSDTTKIVVVGTQIKAEPAAAAVTDLLELLEGDNAASADESSIPENLKLETDPARRRLQLARLERLVRGSQSWQARRVAARLLGSSDELSVVPALIFALSDPDKPTKTFARDGLQFISRRFSEPVTSAASADQQVRVSQQQWRQWYQNIFPNYVFIDLIGN